MMSNQSVSHCLQPSVTGSRSMLANLLRSPPYRSHVIRYKCKYVKDALLIQGHIGLARVVLD